VATLRAHEQGSTPSMFTCLASDGDALIGLCSGRPLAVRPERDANGRIKLVMFSSEAISTSGAPEDGQAWRELDEDELVVVGPDLAIERARLG